MTLSSAGVVQGTPSSAATFTAAVTAVDQGGHSLTESLPIDVTPAAPSSLAARTVTATGWTETWNAVPGATGYTVDLNGSPVGTTSTTSWTVASESSGKAYQVSVSANVGNLQGPFSASQTVTPTSEPHITVTIAPRGAPAGTQPTVQLSPSEPATPPRSLLRLTLSATAGTTPVLYTEPGATTVTVSWPTHAFSHILMVYWNPLLKTWLPVPDVTSETADTLSHRQSPKHFRPRPEHGCTGCPPHRRGHSRLHRATRRRKRVPYRIAHGRTGQRGRYRGQQSRCPIGRGRGRDAPGSRATHRSERIEPGRSFRDTSSGGQNGRDCRRTPSGRTRGCEIPDGGRAHRHAARSRARTATKPPSSSTSTLQLMRHKRSVRCTSPMEPTWRTPRPPAPSCISTRRWYLRHGCDSRRNHGRHHRPCRTTLRDIAQRQGAPTIRQRRRRRRPSSTNRRTRVPPAFSSQTTAARGLLGSCVNGLCAGAADGAPVVITPGAILALAAAHYLHEPQALQATLVIGGAEAMSSPVRALLAGVHAP